MPTPTTQEDSTPVHRRRLNTMFNLRRDEVLPVSRNYMHLFRQM